MSRLDDVIRQTERIQKVDKDYRAWIFNDDGNIRDDVICLDTLSFLKQIKEAEMEINVSDEWIDKFKKGAYNFYSYNYGAACSHDISIWYKENCPIGVVCVHLYGDARGGFSDFFAVKLDDPCWDNTNAFVGLASFYNEKPQFIELDDRYTADLYFFSETYNVYDSERCEDVGEFFGIEKADVLKEIKAREIA